MTRQAIRYDRRAEKDLRAIRDRRVLETLRAAILSLGDNPRPNGAKKLAGLPDLWRLRVGDWRIAYRIDNGRLVVLVVTVARRGEIHARLGR